MLIHNGNIEEFTPVDHPADHPMEPPEPVSAGQAVKVPAASVASAQPVLKQSVQQMDAEDRMTQFRELMAEIVGHAISLNNEEMSVAISQEVQERILKEYIPGDTVYQQVEKDALPEICLQQVKEMCTKLYAAHTNIDYFPTNFILWQNVLYYVDYECNAYMEEWNFENWGIKYWSKTKEFLEYEQTH